MGHVSFGGRRAASVGLLCALMPLNAVADTIGELRCLRADWDARVERLASLRDQIAPGYTALFQPPEGWSCDAPKRALVAEQQFLDIVINVRCTRNDETAIVQIGGMTGLNDAEEAIRSAKRDRMRGGSRENGTAYFGLGWKFEQIGPSLVGVNSGLASVRVWLKTTDSAEPASLPEDHLIDFARVFTQAAPSLPHDRDLLVEYEGELVALTRNFHAQSDLLEQELLRGGIVAKMGPVSGAAVTDDEREEVPDQGPEIMIFTFPPAASGFVLERPFPQVFLWTLTPRNTLIDQTNLGAGRCGSDREGPNPLGACHFHNGYVYWTLDADPSARSDVASLRIGQSVLVSLGTLSGLSQDDTLSDMAKRVFDGLDRDGLAQLDLAKFPIQPGECPPA